MSDPESDSPSLQPRTQPTASDAPAHDTPTNDLSINDRSFNDRSVSDPHHLSDAESALTANPAPTSPAAESTRAASSTITSATSTPIHDFHIGDEFGTAKRNLPPVRILLICIAAVAVVVGFFAFKERPKPQGSGAINFVSAAEVPGQGMILAAITMDLKNTADKPLWIHTLKAQLKTEDGQILEDEAASAVDVDRYLEGFPALKESAEPPLSPEAKLAPGAEQKGTIIVGFKVSKEHFDQRKSLTVAIQPYDQPLPIVLK